MCLIIIAQCHSCAAGSIVTTVSVRAPLNGVMRGCLGERAACVWGMHA